MSKNGKKKLVFQSDFALMKTGFGRNAKALLSYLYKTGKYDIVHYCCGTLDNDPKLDSTPWKSVGTIPAGYPTNKDPEQTRRVSYGSEKLDSVIEKEKPDVYIACQDIWGVDFAIEKPWFNQITSAIWTTLDSLPLLPNSIKYAEQVNNYWVWSDFAEREFNRLGYNNIKTLPGCVGKEDFNRLNDEARLKLRKKFSIKADDFIIGFVFRNQLRKLVPNLIEGFSIWKKTKGGNGKLLLHTHWDEGWDILRLADEYGVERTDILTTYKCSKCSSYKVQPFQGQGLNCPDCLSEKSLTTSNILNGVSEKQLNEVYNLMDVYCHPFTSGGQEIPIQEAKLTELITLVTDYSCGEKSCEEGSGSIALDWSEYREIQTLFRKASTCPNSIAECIEKVYSMPLDERKALGEQARQWTIDNFSTEVIGKEIEKFLDEAPFADYEKVDIKPIENDPEAKISTPRTDAKQWLLSMYRDILKRESISAEDSGFRYWMGEIQKGVELDKIEKFFRETALKHNQKIKKFDLNSLLDSDDKGKRVLYVIPQSAGDVFMSTALFPSIKELYPDWNLYVATNKENFPILHGNPNIHRILPYTPQMDNLFWLEGHGDHEGYFEVAYLPYIGTQKIFNYQHNGIDKLALDLKL